MEGSLGRIPAPRQDAAAMAVPAARPQLLEAVPEFEKIEGWLKLGAAQLLFEAAASVRAGCIVEIGSYRGRSTVALGAGARAGAHVPVYAIEPHEHFVGIKGGVYGPSDRRAFFRNLLAMKLTGIVRLVNAASEVVAPGWDKPVSLLFIDGDHRYDAVSADFALWRPHLFDGAIVIFQDAPGPGPAAVIRDNVAAGVLTPLRSLGQMAMFRYHLVEGVVAHAATSFTPGVSQYPGLRLHKPEHGPERHRQGDANTLFSAPEGYLFQAIPGCRAASVKPLLTDLHLLSGANAPALVAKPSPELLPAEVRAELSAAASSYLRFVFVRDPYTRLAAAFNNKIARGFREGRHHVIDIVKAAAATLGITLSEPITFDEFVRVVAAQEVDAMDPLWRPQFLEGHFARVNYDVIGRVETLATDLSYVLERLGAPADFMHRAILPTHSDGARLGVWSETKAATRAAFLKTFEIDFDSLRYPKRRASILFSPAESYFRGYVAPAEPE